MLDHDKEAFDKAIRHHDRSVAAKGLTLWVGAEPTFTDRLSEAPEWLYEAEGGDKASRALGLLARLSQDLPHSLILRTLGRQYPGENLPRWNFGIYQRRDGAPVWSGPVDPMLGGLGSPESSFEGFLTILARRFEERDWGNIRFRCDDQPDWRIAFRLDALSPPENPAADVRLARPSLHAQAIPSEGLSDPLAAEGIYLISVYPMPGRKPKAEASDSRPMPQLELPAFPNVQAFLACLIEIGQAATEAGLNGLILAGYPPPVDRTIAWTTVTPDPAVIEINMAPSPNVEEFLGMARSLYPSAIDQGLSAYRFHYNGDVTDSGGGGQITFGGPAPEASPFFLKPWLLPNIIRYFNRHPALSYFFTPTCVGSSSQSPRPDERFRESFEELKLALGLLAMQDNCEPELLWASLAPFLTDASGNSHRSEINVEKLWNPNLIERGCLGLVEFRAFCMASSAETLTARAALFRAVIAMLAVQKDLTGLIDWGAELHKRFALPFFLKQDLLEILKDLSRAGLGLGKPIVERLVDDSDRILGQAELGGCRLSIKRALEFWPLVEASAGQDRGTSRLIDSSTTRIQVTLRPHSGSLADIRDWRVSSGKWRIPVRYEQDHAGPVLVFGLQYRLFMPWRGLHPTLGIQTPVELTFQKASTGETYRITLHDWKPEGGGYNGLPGDGEESRRRRNERMVLETLGPNIELALVEPPPLATTDYGLDLRACPNRELV